MAARINDARQKIGFVYFIPMESNIFTASHGQGPFRLYRCTFNAESPGRLPYSVPWATVGQAMTKAKLQKEHAFGHEANF
jgi:hypothetical protein